jgi:heat shock protein HslJ
MLATRNWSLNNGQLIEEDIQETGTLSLSMMEGSKWVLTHMDRNKPVAEGAEVTLDFNGERISGKSACNRYSAGIEQGKVADEIKIGQAMSTMMACPDELMNIEREFLALLSRVTGFSFYAGRLALNGNNEDETPFSLLFKPGSAE